MRIDLEESERTDRHLGRDQIPVLDLRVVAHTAEQIVRDTRSTAASARDLERPAFVNVDAELLG